MNSLSFSFLFNPLVNRRAVPKTRVARPRGLSETRLKRSVALAVFLAIGSSAFSATYYVSPNGAGKASNGSLSKPWTLTTALSHPAVVQPGDTILMLGGNYSGANFYCNLQGAPGNPITLAQAPGVQASIVGSSTTAAVLTILRPYVILRGFDVSHSSTRKRTAGSRGDAISMRASNTRLINLSVHDAANGIGYWQEAADSEVYGCVVFNTGDSRWAHGIYSLNLAGSTSEKWIVDNVVVNSFGRNLHVYAETVTHSLANFRVLGNTFANAASIDRSGDFSENLLVGGEIPVSGAVIRNNRTYNLDQNGHNHIGYSLVGPKNLDALVEDNYFGNPTMFRFWDALTVQHNTFAGPGCLALFDERLTDPTVSLSWDNNEYFWPPQSALPFGYNAEPIPGFIGNLSFDDWKTVMGGRGWGAVDPSSSYVAALPSTLEVFIQPNQYEPGRANITVFNWQHFPTVTVDLSTCGLANGQAYRIQNAQDFLGSAVRTGTFSTATPTVSLPMTGLKVATPRGTAAPPAPTDEFSVFICLPQ